MRRVNMLPALLAVTMLGASIAAPAQALKPPPKDTPTGSSGGNGTPVPEPSSLILFGAGAAAFMLTKRRKQDRD